MGAISIPVFWLGIVGILVFAVHWRLLPAGGAETVGGNGSLADRLQHLLGHASITSTYIYLDSLAEAQELQRSIPANPELMALVGELAAEAGNSDLAIAELKRAVGRIGPSERLGSTDGVYVRKLLAKLAERQMRGAAS